MSFLGQHMFILKSHEMNALDIVTTENELTLVATSVENWYKFSLSFMPLKYIERILY